MRSCFYSSISGILFQIYAGLGLFATASGIFLGDNVVGMAVFSSLYMLSLTLGLWAIGTSTIHSLRATITLICLLPPLSVAFFPISQVLMNTGNKLLALVFGLAALVLFARAAQLICKINGSCRRTNTITNEPQAAAE